MAAVLRPRSLGGLLAHTLQLVVRRFPQLLAIQVVFWGAVTPVAALSVLLLLGDVQPEEGRPLDFLVRVWDLLQRTLFGILAHLPTAASFRAVASEFTGQPAGLGLCFRTALGRLPTLIGVGLVVGFLGLVGFLLLIVPGLIVVATFAVAAPAAVVERLGVGTALGRNLARVVDQVPLLWLLPVLDPLRRRLGDHLAGTLVVLVERAAEPSPFPPGLTWSRLPERRFVLGQAVRRRLVREDLDLLEYFFRQRVRLRRAGPAGRQAAREVALRYVRRLGLDDQEAAVRADPLRFLQELYFFLREAFLRERF